MIKENKYYSYNIKQLPIGCRFCVRGEKMVLFITGKCPRNCYFCPVSDHKSGKDIIYANERLSNSPDDIIKEAKLMRAKGAGITGGDPLIELNRTIKYIKLLKEEFGKEFHIHLYTSLNLVTNDSLKKLYNSGLDEIRFHLDLDNKKFWKNLELAKNYNWDIGIEIPLIPNKDKETKEMIDYIQDKVQFLNLNELEIADNKQSKLNEMGFTTKDKLSYAIKGSLEHGLNMIKYIKEKEYDLAVHLCTAKLKDKIQLTNRIKRESKNFKKKFDKVDQEGLLTRGAIYLPKLSPGFDYRKKLDSINKEEYTKKLELHLDKIKSKLKLKENDYYLDPNKPRILISEKIARRKFKTISNMGLKVAIVVEYPTADQLEIEVEFLE